MNREFNNQKFQETFNKHKSLLNETLNLNNEIGASYGEPVSGMSETYDADDHERQQYQSKINKYNKAHKQRFPCPTCGEEDALSAWEKSKGYQCNKCADAEEFGMNEGTPPGFPKDIKAKIIKKYGKTPKAYATMWTLHKKLNEMLSESNENRVCSYCQKELNIKPEKGQTHGMCKRHAKKFMNVLGKSAEDFDKMDPKLFCPDLKK